MPWYQVMMIVLGAAVSALVLGRAFVAGFDHRVADVMSGKINELHKALDELDRLNATRFAALDNAIGDIQAQFQPNGGDSHRDRLEALHAQVTAVAAKLDRMSGA